MSTTSPIQRKHEWTTHQRLTLGVLTKFYILKNSQTTQIFNFLYRDDLQREGLDSGLTVGAIVSQIADLRTSSRGQAFQDILSLDADTARQDFRDERDAIERAASEMGVILQIRPMPASPSINNRQHDRKESSAAIKPNQTITPVVKHTDDGVPNSEQRLLRPRAQLITSCNAAEIGEVLDRTRDLSHDLTYCPTSSDNESDSDTGWSIEAESEAESEADSQDINNLGEEHFPHTSRRIPAQLRLRFDNAGRSVKTRPRLLFRAFEPAHGLCARKFLHQQDSIPSPPNYDDKHHFRSAVEPHLRADRTYTSPFLSWAESPARAIRLIASNNTRGATPRSLAVVDYNVLEQEVHKRFGQGTGLWLVPEICKNFGLGDLRKVDATVKFSRRRNYTGTGEFLSWGSVETAPVAILETQCVLEIVDFMTQIKKQGIINYEIGLSMARHLRKIPDIYLQVFSYKLIRSFKIRHPLPSPTSGMFKQFVAGLYNEPLDRSYSCESYRSVSVEDDASDASDSNVSLGESRVPKVMGTRFNSFRLRHLHRQSRQDSLTVEIPAKLPADIAKRRTTAGDDWLSLKDENNQSQSTDSQEPQEAAEPFGDGSSTGNIPNDKNADPSHRALLEVPESQAKWSLAEKNQQYQLFHFQDTPSATRSARFSKEPGAEAIASLTSNESTIARRIVKQSQVSAEADRPSPLSTPDALINQTKEHRSLSQDLSLIGELSPSPAKRLKVAKKRYSDIVRTTSTSTEQRTKTNVTTTSKINPRPEIRSSKGAVQEIAIVNTEDQAEESDFEIIGTRSHSHHFHSHLRTRTILTIRSRSLSETITNNKPVSPLAQRKSKIPARDDVPPGPKEQRSTEESRFAFVMAKKTAPLN